ncbi:D-glycero-beta-D-manno-heptose 1-phosphate adenylyltransferase [Specibacter sp. NPDC057265]|uniref:D-glycero-beta-D-manno-heptose 1-phosphate adenylyltransferase n=1 Tax=Specibacter sp. NPDC057265 TaxID=3346075 RepID=UPI0036423D31
MKICVVGDVLLDQDWDGAATRLCPDAPVPVIDLQRQQIRAGGAGLVASLLLADGHDVTLVTALAADDGATQLRRALTGVQLLAAEIHGPTPSKTRLRANKAQVARIDSGCQDVRQGGATAAMVAACARAEVIVVADYGHGLLRDPLLREVLQARAAVVPVVWDPHPRGVEPVPGVAAVTPNLGEALTLSGTQGNGIEAATRAGRALLQRWHSRAVVVTLAERGALMLQNSDGEGVAPLLLPAPVLTVADSCGAGDRFASALAVHLAQAAPISTAVEAAVGLTGRFLHQGGVASLAPNPATGAPEFDTAPGAPESGTGHSVPAQGFTSAQELAAQVRARGGTVVATGGCFDLLHAGHVRMLAQARALGDCLIVLLNSDSSVRARKGPQRPINAEAERMELLHALASVDAVVLFQQDTPEQALRTLRPDVWVKGADYSADTLPEAQAVRSWGGQVVTVPYHRQHSTTLLAQALARAGN